MADKWAILPSRKESSAMTQRLTVIAKKGGVGKTTILMALAGHLATAGKRVLIVDLDPQATASSNCLTKNTAHSLPGDRTIMALFHDECEPDPEQIIHQSHLENIWVLPANDHFAPYLDPRPLEAPVSDQIAIADFLQEVEEQFDWVLLDSTPALENLAAWNCLTAAHFVVSPVQMEGYSAQTVVGVEEAVAAALQYGNSELKFLGYIVSEFDKTRTADHAQAEHALRARYNQQVFDSVIYRRAKLPQSQNADQHIHSYAPKSAESKMIDRLAEELMQRIEKSKARRAA
jgi:chromosome partitioning protein